MRIGELARRSGLSNSRIRFYEAAGLLGAIEREANGYRVYPPDTLLRLQIILLSQAAGFSLEQIRGFLPSAGGHWNHGALWAALQAQLEQVEVQQARLAASKAVLLEVMRQVQDKPEQLDCSDNARRVMSEVQLPRLSG